MHNRLIGIYFYGKIFPRVCLCLLLIFFAKDTDCAGHFWPKFQIMNRSSVGNTINYYINKIILVLDLESKTRIQVNHNFFFVYNFQPMCEGVS